MQFQIHNSQSLIMNETKSHSKSMKTIQDLNALKTALNFPELYITEFFSELKSRIDIKCEIFVSQLADPTGEDYQQAINYQSILIHELCKFERQCLQNLQLNKSTELINDESLSLHSDANLNDFVYETFLQFQKEIFLNRTIVFLSKDNGAVGDYELLSCFDLSSLASFGTCLVLEDEFIGERGFRNLYFSVFQFVFI